jgi:protein-disulfide isomerase
MNPIHTKTLFSRGLALAGVAALATTALVSAEQAKPAAPAAKPATAAPAAEIKYKTNVKGPADAPIKVVEFADFMCPGCQAASGALRSWFAQQGPDINLTFKNFPLEQSCNPGAICASELGNFWAYHDRIFSRSWEVATRQDVVDNGVAVGLNKAKFEACLAAPSTQSALALQIKEAFEIVVRVTPTLIVNGKKLEATNQFANVVEMERKKLAEAKAAAPKTK